jgi:hypothetical protein
MHGAPLFHLSSTLLHLFGGRQNIKILNESQQLPGPGIASVSMLDSTGELTL